jgi:hypothetical protein
MLSQSDLGTYLPHQLKAFKKLKTQDFGGIFFEQGLGKTFLAIKLLDYWLKENSVDAGIIVTRRNLISNWKSEFSRFSKTRVFCPQVKGDSVNYSIIPSKNIFLMHYEGFNREILRLKEFFEAYNICIILDEAHYIKNPSTNNSLGILSISDFAKKRLILTGTPIPNRPYDLWNLCRFLDPSIEKSVSYKTLKRIADIPATRQNLEERLTLLESAVVSLKRRIASTSVFAFKSSLNIPKKTILYQQVALPPLLRKRYDDISSHFKGQFNLTRSLKDDCILRRYLELIQFCSYPGMKTKSLKGPFPKDLIILSQIKKAKKEKASIIIWTAFNETSEYLFSLINSYFPRERVFLVNGKTALQKRHSSLGLFKKTSFGILVATIGTCKEGLNLQNASIAIFVDSTYKLDDFLQAQDRIHRLFQKRKCKVIQLLYKNTIEIWIHNLLKTKEHVAKDVFNKERSINQQVFEEMFSEKEALNES